VAHETRKVEPLTINHQGVFPAVTLSFNLAPGASLSQAVDAIAAAKASLGAPATLVGQFEGTAQAFQASLLTMPLLVAAAILTIHIIMGMLYESFIHPVTILSALPAAGVGALLIVIATRASRPRRGLAWPLEPHVRACRPVLAHDPVGQLLDRGF
jgi:multidrug efflux pump subunit AcrB